MKRIRLKDIKCCTCTHMRKKNGCVYCNDLHYYPDIKLIYSMGCANYKTYVLNLFDFGG